MRYKYFALNFMYCTRVFLRCFRDPNRVPRYVNRVPRIKKIIIVSLESEKSVPYKSIPGA